MTDAVILPGPDETAADAERGFARRTSASGFTS